MQDVFFLKKKKSTKHPCSFITIPHPSPLYYYFLHHLIKCTCRGDSRQTKGYLAEEGCFITMQDRTPPDNTWAQKNRHRELTDFREGLKNKHESDRLVKEQEKYLQAQKQVQFLPSLCTVSYHIKSKIYLFPKGCSLSLSYICFANQRYSASNMHIHIPHTIKEQWSVRVIMVSLLPLFSPLQVFKVISPSISNTHLLPKMLN